MSPQPKRSDTTPCTAACGTTNDPDRGGTQCADPNCRAPLPSPWGGDYLAQEES